MSIKKSSLEKKWYYRVGKVFFLILPILLLLLLLLNWWQKKKLVVCSFTEEIVPELWAKDILFLVFILILYYVILRLVWRLALYVFFGGLEDDSKENVGGIRGQGDGAQASSVAQKEKIKQILPLIILMIIFFLIILFQLGYLPSFKLAGDGGSSSLKVCHNTSAEWGIPCHTGQGGVAVLGLPVPDYCECPTDTVFASMDNITPGGPWKICTCK